MTCCYSTCFVELLKYLGAKQNQPYLYIYIGETQYILYNIVCIVFTPGYIYNIWSFLGIAAALIAQVEAAIPGYA